MKKLITVLLLTMLGLSIYSNYLAPTHTERLQYQERVEHYIDGIQA